MAGLYAMVAGTYTQADNIHFKILKTIATSGFLTALECTKFVFGRGSAPDPLGELKALRQTPYLV